MSSETIRNEVKQHAPTDKSIWPNGLGYSYRGWDYSYGHRGWAAQRGDKLGWGSNPAEAKSTATVREGV